MIEIITDKLALSRWYRHEVGESGEDRRCVAVGLKRDGKIVAAAIFRHFFWPDIEIHFAINGLATEEYTREVFKYPFIEAGALHITAPIPASNHKCIRLAEHLGFVQEGIKRNAHKDGDLLLYGMTKEECQWL